MLIQVWLMCLAIAVLSVDARYSSTKEECLVKPVQSCELDVLYQDVNVDCDAVVPEKDRSRMTTAPSIYANVLPTSTPVLLIMFDPDAPVSETNGFAHWIAEGHISESSMLVVETEYLEYFPPTPPAGSGPHRYQIFLFEKAESVMVNGRGMDLCDFVKSTFGATIQPLVSFQFKFEVQ